MALPKVLVDSGFLYVLFRKNDPDHQAVRTVFDSLDAEFIVPQVVLTEACWLFNRAGGMPLVATFLELLTSARIPLEPANYVDVYRASQLMRQYVGTKLDFVDCCILALAERLEITQVATLDRRDFSIMRTRHGRYLDILP
ncbi:MAG: PIN domain-containing protein [Chloroflexota bacterium]|nr:PIN domain-containing protein [Chloroflexota bacterium]